MFEHLCKNISIKLTDFKNIPFKCEGFNKPWDTSTHLATYFMYLDDFKANLKAWYVHTTEEEKIQVAIARMWVLVYFLHDNMVQWKNQHMDDQN